MCIDCDNGTGYTYGTCNDCHEWKAIMMNKKGIHICMSCHMDSPDSLYSQIRVSNG